jgi:hypothetical protein
MGVYVDLYVLEEHISAESWRQFYDESLTVIARCDLELLRLRKTLRFGYPLCVLSTDLFDHDESTGLRSWTVHGDAGSRTFAESFRLRSEPRRRSPTRSTNTEGTAGTEDTARTEDTASTEDTGASDDTAASPPTSRDVAVELAEEQLRSEPCQVPGPVLLFNNKTQGLPYHTFVLAIALLCENRFPGAAIASGDIGPEDSEEARRLLERTLGESFDLPLVVQRTRLEQRRKSISFWRM